MQPTIRFLPHVSRSIAGQPVQPTRRLRPSRSRGREAADKRSDAQIPALTTPETRCPEIAAKLNYQSIPASPHNTPAPPPPRISPGTPLLLRVTIVGLLFALSFLLAGCSSYVNSRAAADHRAKAEAAFSHPLIARAYNAKPAMTFPATIGLAPMDHETQLPLRNLDATGKLDALKSLPQLAHVTNVSSLLISTNGEIAGPNGQPVALWNKSDLALREAAARLHCDAVLLLKIDTSVTDGKVFAPLTLVTLGMFPNDRTEVISTALAALVDTRTGYVYATAERSAGKTCHAISWDDDTRDRTMRLANQKAMEKLFSDFPALWSGIVAKHR